MAEEVIRFGAGGVPYKPTTIAAPEPVIEVEEEAPAVTVEVIEKEALGDIPEYQDIPKGKIKK